MSKAMTAEGRHTFDVAGREIEYFCKPAKRANAPVLFILHGHNHAAAPSSFRSEEYHVVCPMDRFGVNQAGSWWLGEDGDFFWIEAMATLVKAFRDSGAEDVYFWGSSMGGWGAILHGYLNNAKAVYANIPQTVLLGSSYAEKAGMKKYFQRIPGDRLGEFNDLKDVVRENRCEYFLCFNLLEKHDYFKEQGLAFVSHLNEIGARFYLEVRPQDSHGKNHGIQESVGLFERYSVGSGIHASGSPMHAENKALHPTVNDAMTRVGLATTLKKQLEQPPVKPVSTRTSVAFQSVIPFGADGLANLKFELIESTSASLIFLEDHQVLPPDGGDEVREIVATNGSRNRLLVSRDLGASWTQELAGIEFDSKIRAVFSLSDGGRIVRTLSGRMHHLDARGELVRAQETGPWPWHGSQGIGESRNGTVMYAEYAPLRVEDGTQDVSVWRYRPGQSEDGWQKVLTLPAAARPPHGQLRCFRVCRPNPHRPDEWVLASGDVGAHCRLWFSVDDGTTWREVPLPDPIMGGVSNASIPRVLRFTQFSTLANGDLIWGTDDTTHAGRAALIRLSLASGRPEFFLEGGLGKNCVRNIASSNGQIFLLLSESKHDRSSADCIVYDVTTRRLTSLLLPNLGQTSQTVTDSLGSANLLDGVGFFPASGAVLMDPGKRGVFRVSIKEIVK